MTILSRSPSLVQKTLGVLAPPLALHNRRGLGRIVDADLVFFHQVLEIVIGVLAGWAGSPAAAGAIWSRPPASQWPLIGPRSMA